MTPEERPVPGPAICTSRRHLCGKETGPRGSLIAPALAHIPTGCSPSEEEWPGTPVGGLLLVKAPGLLPQRRGVEVPHHHPRGVNDHREVVSRLQAADGLPAVHVLHLGETRQGVAAGVSPTFTVVSQFPCPDHRGHQKEGEAGRRGCRRSVKAGLTSYTAFSGKPSLARLVV